MRYFLINNIPIPERTANVFHRNTNNYSR